VAVAVMVRWTRDGREVYHLVVFPEGRAVATAGETGGNISWET